MCCHSQPGKKCLHTYLSTCQCPPNTHYNSAVPQPPFASQGLCCCHQLRHKGCLIAIGCIIRAVSLPPAASQGLFHVNCLHHRSYATAIGCITRVVLLRWLHHKGCVTATGCVTSAALWPLATAHGLCWRHKLHEKDMFTATVGLLHEGCIFVRGCTSWLSAVLQCATWPVMELKCLRKSWVQGVGFFYPRVWSDWPE